MRLLRVELTRLRSRRAYWFLVLLALAGILLALGSNINASQPPSASDRAAAQEQLDREMVFYQDEFDRCVEEQESGETVSFPADFDCDDLLPQVEWFLSWEEPNFVDDLQEFLSVAALMLAMAGALVGATFAGAEWAAGTIGTHLLFEPRRGRVFVSKAGAMAIGMTLPALIGFGAIYIGLWLTASAWGSTELIASSFERQADGSEIEVFSDVSWLDLGLFGLRSLAFVVVAGVGGYVLAMAFRSSLAAVGTVAAYGLVGEGLVRSLWSGSEPWLLSNRLTAWLMGGHEIVDYPDDCGFGPCEPDITVLTTWDGGLYLAALLVVGLAVSYALFRRRDVT